MSKSFGSTKSTSLKKSKPSNFNDTNISSNQRLNQSKFSLKNDNKTINKSVSNNELKIEFMAKTKKEIGDQYLKTNVDENLRCKVCKNLFTEPVCCYKCQAIYCFSCIKKEINAHSRCPSCYNIVFSDMMILMEADYKENYKKYNVKCPHEGCKESYNLNEIKDHLNTCLFKVVNNTEKIQKISYSNVKKVNLTKIKEDDIYLRHYLLNYNLKNYEKIISNKKKDISEIEFSNCGLSTANSSINQNPDIGNYSIKLVFIDKIPSITATLNNLTDYISRTVNALSNKTKKTNDKVKKKFNKTNLSL